MKEYKPMWPRNYHEIFEARVQPEEIADYGFPPGHWERYKSNEVYERMRQMIWTDISVTG